MKTYLWQRVVAVLVLAAAFTISALSAQAQSIPAPGMAVSLTGTNQLLISITNGVTNANYELYYTPVLGDAAYPWTQLAVGTVGQTNFTVDRGVSSQSFYLLAVGLDWDNDGIPNTEDADPNNASVGRLTITIDSPSNGFTFN